jgi:SHS2 domain-containing protein
MVEDLATIAPRQQRTFALHEAQLDLLLLQFLQELLFYKDAQRLLLRVSEVHITAQEQGFALQARAAGEPLDPARHALGADVKGVTLHRLQVIQTPTGWEATVVLDV